MNSNLSAITLKLLLLVTLVCAGLPSDAQRILKGNVKDALGIGIPGVKIKVQNTTYGVITNSLGDYFIELQEKKEYALTFFSLGYKDTTVSIQLEEFNNTLNLILQEEIREFDIIEVNAEEIDVAKMVIQNVQKSRKNYLNSFSNFSCISYAKTGMEKYHEFNPRKDSINDPALVPSMFSLTETFSENTFIPKSFYHTSILAFHDYSDKEASSTGSFLDYYQDDNIVPIQSIEIDPYLFYEKLEDGDFNIYKNLIYLPKITEHPIISPIGNQAFISYKFDLNNIFFEGDQKIYEIQVTPRNRTETALSGSLYILDSTWAVKSFSLEISQYALKFAADFSIIQDYELMDGHSVAERREFTYTIHEEGSVFNVNTRVDYTNYKFNEEVIEKDFHNEIMSYALGADNKDSLYWMSNRPITLKENELEFIDEQINIDNYKSSEVYLDSMDSVYNKVHFFDPFLNGMGFRNSHKKQEVFIDPIFDNINFIGIGGLRLGASGFYSKKFENNHILKISPGFNVGTSVFDPKGKLGAEYTFDPLHFGKLGIEFGSTYDLVTNQAAVLDWIGANNKVNHNYFEILHRREIVNGLYGQVKFRYSDKRSLGEMKYGEWVDNLINMAVEADTSGEFKGFIENFNTPLQFEQYKMSLLEIKFHYRFKQKYIIKGGEKQIVGTELPELEFTFKQGIPGLFSSEVSFNQIEVKISDEINFGKLGTASWKVIGGSFLNKNNLRFIEHKFFRGSDPSLLSNPMYTHQGLDSTLNTNGLYAQGFFVHHFNGFLFNKIPFINRLKLEAVGGASFLYIQNQNFFHPEFFIGIEKKFRVLKQYMKFGVYLNQGITSNFSPVFRFKIGFDMLNTFTNKWSY